MAEQSQSSGNGGVSPRVNFDYIKSQHFRVIHMDGAIGGLTPNGHIHMSLYSERPAIPRRIVHSLEGNRLGDEIQSERITRDAIVREMDVDVQMTINAAIALRDWLDRQIQEHDRQHPKA